MATPGKTPFSRPLTQPRAKGEVETRKIPGVQEEASVSCVVEKTGKAVRVRMESYEERQRVPVTEIFEEVSVERVPVNRYVDERTGPREEAGVVIIPVFETVPVVEERLLLKEEVHIVRQQREVQREEEVVLRKDAPIIERRASGQEDWSQDPPDQ